MFMLVMNSGCGFLRVLPLESRPVIGLACFVVP